METINSLINYYEKLFDCKGFYNFLRNKIQSNKEDYYQKEINFGTINNNIDFITDADLKVVDNDLRIDMPVIIGSNKSNKKTMLLGMEPRHTDNSFNIAKFNSQVYGTPFGIDQWHSKSKQNVYSKAFKEIINLENLIIFSDFVKEYKVIDSTNKKVNDEFARSSFKELFNEKYADILEEEIKLFKPNVIIGLGIKAIKSKIPNAFLEKHNIIVISHPGHGNINRTIEALRPYI